jgi:hypothetical protein
MSRVTRSATHTFRVAAIAVVVTPFTAVPAQHRTELRTELGAAREAMALGPAPNAGAWQQPARRRSASARIALQFLAASAGAVGGGIAGWATFEDVGERRVKGDAGYTRAANVAYLVGSFAGSTLGAHLVGTRMGGRSPLWATTLGALVGTSPLIALGIDEPYMPLIGIALGWIPQAALATGGFNMAER